VYVILLVENFSKVDVIVKIDVYYEDTDIGGVVYYANYLKFIERARSDFFFSKGLLPFSTDQKIGHFVVRRVEADYLASATLGDTLDVQTELVALKGASFELDQCVYRDGVKLFEAHVALVYVIKGKPSRIAPHLKEVIESMPKVKI
jgi:acyl-CoA thioester hydrolase